MLGAPLLSHKNDGFLRPGDNGYEAPNLNAEVIRVKIIKKRELVKKYKEELETLEQEYREAMGMKEGDVLASDISPMFPATAEYLTGAVRDPVEGIEGGRKTHKKRHSYKKKSKNLRSTRRRKKTHSYKKKSKNLRSTRRRRR